MNLDSGSELRAFFGWGKYDQIIGHEGVGTVVRLGGSVSSSMEGTRVGVRWLFSCCYECPTCQRGTMHVCPHQSNTGRTCPGTLQQYVIADARHIVEIPGGLPSEVAAPLLCAGLTMMGALGEVRHSLVKTDWVVILGSGGGLGHIGIQLASRVLGLRVIAVDSGPTKRSLSLKSGAEVFVDYTNSDISAEVQKHTGEGAAAVIVVSDSKDAFRLSAEISRPTGTILCVGIPPNDLDIPISVSLCIRKGMMIPAELLFHDTSNTPLSIALTIKGVVVGSDDQMHELFQYATQGLVKPLVEVADLEKVPESIQRMVNKEVTGRIVVAMPP